MTTTPLPPSSSSSLTPKYDNIDDLIQDIWHRSLEIEEQYYKTGNSKLIQSFALNIVIIQFWEDLHLRITQERARANDKKG